MVLVDWSERASKPYTEAVLEVPTIGEYVASLIKGQLVGVGRGSLSNINLAGHSLGAHISGVIGRRYTFKKQKKNMFKNDYSSRYKYFRQNEQQNFWGACEV